MLSLQQLLDIACRHATAMSDAMVCACVGRALETGEALRMPRGHAPFVVRVERPEERIDWELIVRGNSDTRLMHV